MRGILVRVIEIVKICNNIKNRTYYFSDNMFNKKGFGPNKININEKSYKNIIIYCLDDRDAQKSYLRENQQSKFYIAYY